jgi:hypothetical protein
MKKVFAFLILSLTSLILSGCTPVSNSHFYLYEKGDCLSSKFSNVDSELDINITWKYDAIHLDWQEYSGTDFHAYYIIREEGGESTCPYYYSGSDYLKTNINKTQTTYSDTSAESGKTYYYRVCVQKTDKNIDCGGVLKVEVY